jgi:ABC-type nitrate/sulfonate/bicarbonate transport system permease component
MVVNRAIVASPADTVRALAELAWSGELWRELLVTLRRLVLGLLIYRSAHVPSTAIEPSTAPTR